MIQNLLVRCLDSIAGQNQLLTSVSVIAELEYVITDSQLHVYELWCTLHNVTLESESNNQNDIQLSLSLSPPPSTFLHFLLLSGFSSFIRLNHFQQEAGICVEATFSGHNSHNLQ